MFFVSHPGRSSVLLVAFSSLVVGTAGPVAWAQVVGAEIIAYSDPAESTYTAPAAALGLPARSGAFGDLTPFSPAFAAGDLLRLQRGGSVTIRLSAAIPATAERTLGVISNIGLADGSLDGSGVATSPATAFSDFPLAQVSVSSDNVSYFPISAGLTTFNMPAVGFVDTPPWTFYSPSGGTTPTDFTKPTPLAVQDGGLASFSGLAHPQIVSLLAGSGGGTWLSLGASGLSSVQYVRFEVPSSAPAGTRFVLDAVVAVPEPVGASVVLGAASAALLRRRGGGAAR